MLQSLLTAEEAATKWCPLARVGGYLTANRIGPDPSSWPKCIADDCMLWEWRPTPADSTQRGTCGIRERA
jgi:hypothetical protein